MKLKTTFEKVLDGKRPSEEERAYLLDWFVRAENLPGSTNPVTGQTTVIQTGPTQGEIDAMVQQAISSGRVPTPRVSDLTRELGLMRSGEFRTGNGVTPGDGFTGGRYGWPGFTYDATTYFLVGVENDVLQVGLSLADGKIYAGAGAVVLDDDGITATTGTIGGWVIGATSIEDAAGTVGMSSAVAFPGDDVRFWAGNVDPEIAPFFVRDDGFLRASDAEITGQINATTGLIGGWTIEPTRFYSFPSGDGIELNSSNQTILVGNPAGNYILLDGANERIRSSNFVTGASGFNIASTTGDAEFNNITARGELKTFLLTSSNQMAVAGNIIVSQDAGKLGADVTAIATTVNFGKALTPGDWIKIQGPDSAGAAALEWMLVGSLVSGTTYNVTRDVDGSGANAWLKDTPFVVIGASGDSRIELVAGASGSIQLITQGATWNTQTVQASMSTVDGAIVAGGGNVLLSSGGIAVLDDGAAGSFFSFYDETGVTEQFAFKINNGDMQFQSLVAGKGTSWILKTTDNSTPYINWIENPSIANATLLEINEGADGGRVAFGADHFIDFLDDGGNGSATVYFNERGHDIDVLIKDIDNATLLQTDAAGGFAYAKSLKWDGWQKETATWTRTGNHTFTVSGDVTATYRKGAKARYKDGGSYEYGVIFSSSYSAPNTTVTLITNSDYAMAAATITDTYLSYIDNPEGFPQWFNYSPAISGSGGSAGAYAESESSCKFTVSGGLLHTRIHKVVSNVGSWTGTLRVSTPATIVVQTTGSIILNGSIYASGATAATQLGVLYEVDATFWTFIKQVRTAQVTWADVAANVGIHIDTFSEF
jgi:hypothetical protein